MKEITNERKIKDEFHEGDHYNFPSTGGREKKGGGITEGEKKHGRGIIKMHKCKHRLYILY